MRRLFAALFLGGAALAQTDPPSPLGADLYVPGTQVSVRLEQSSETGRNISSIFIDERYDTLGQTFAQFRCREGGRLAFFLSAKVPLLTEAQVASGRLPSLSYRVDGQQPRRFPGVPTRKGGEIDRFVLAVSDAADARFVAAFRAARRQVEVQVTRPGAAPIVLNFPVKGFGDALRAVDGCRPLP